ncbi:unnamed protein product, partial [Linum tenue]
KILIRLPNPSSSCRCKAVCQGWRSLISSPGFNRRFVSHHRSRNQQPPLLLPSDDSQSNIQSFLFMNLIGEFSFSVLDSYKDLTLCGFETRSHGQLLRTFFVCNPFTKQWVALPLAAKSPDNRWIIFPARLVCESRINLDLGDGQLFAYEYRFRVVCLYPDGGFLKMNLFCSDSREWTKDALVLDDKFLSPSRKCSFVQWGVVLA